MDTATLTLHLGSGLLLLEVEARLPVLAGGPPLRCNLVLHNTSAVEEGLMKNNLSALLTQ